MREFLPVLLLTDEFATRGAVSHSHHPRWADYLYPTMIHLTDNELEALLPPNDLIAAVRDAMLWDEQHPGNVPQRIHINKGENTYLTMPAFGPGFHGTKMVSVVPANSAKGLPVISGMYILYDSATGETLAWTGAGKLTALRTGAIAAVAVDQLADTGIASAGIIGCGVQGIHAAQLLPFVRPLKRLYILSRSQSSVERFHVQLSARHPGLQIEVCRSAEEMLEATATVITATTSAHPVLPDDEKLLSGKCLIALGAYRRDMQELPLAAVRLSRCIMTDAEGTRHETGDLRRPVDAAIISEEEIFTLGKVMLGLRRPGAATRVFKSAGYALFDLFAATAAWRRRTG